LIDYLNKKKKQIKKIAERNKAIVTSQEDLRNSFKLIHLKACVLKGKDKMNDANRHNNDNLVK